MLDFLENHILEISKILGGIGGICGFLFGCYKYIVKPVSRHFLAIREAVSKVETIHAEIRPNGGKSLKDVVNRLEINIFSINEKLNTIHRTQDALREDIQVGIFECSVEGENTYVNRTYAKWIGVSKSDLMGYGWKNFLASFAQQEEYEREWREAFKEGREVKFPISFKNSHGERFFCDVHAYPIKDPENNVYSYLGILSKEKDVNKLLTRKDTNIPIAS